MTKNKVSKCRCGMDSRTYQPGVCSMWMVTYPDGVKLTYRTWERAMFRALLEY